VAFLTGDTLSPETTAFLKRTRVLTMAKPFTLEQVRQVLQKPRFPRSSLYNAVYVGGKDIELIGTARDCVNRPAGIRGRG
jgi:hypothetical protein